MDNITEIHIGMMIISLISLCQFFLSIIVLFKIFSVGSKIDRFMDHSSRLIEDLSTLSGNISQLTVKLSESVAYNRQSLEQNKKDHDALFRVANRIKDSVETIRSNGRRKHN